MIRDFIFYRRAEQNKEIEAPLLQTDTEDRVESVNIIIFQVLEQIYNNKTKASLRIPSLISLWNILLKGFYGNLNWEHDIYIPHSHYTEKEHLHSRYKGALIY